MKLKTIYYHISKPFTKSITIPNKLKTKTTKKIQETHYPDQIKNLLKSEKFAENRNETFNSLEKTSYFEIVSNISKKMLKKYFTNHDEKELENLENLYVFLNESLTSKEVNLFITHITEAKSIIKKDSIEKNEKIFFTLIDKLFNLTQRRNINEYLLNLVSNISIANLNTNNIFQFSNKNGVNMDNSIYYSELSIANSLNSANINNPILNDFEDPQKEYKDAFILKNQYYFNHPLLMQMKSNLTSFDKTKFLYFSNMPFFYPMRNKETSIVEFKHLNNETIIKNSINLQKNDTYKNFLKMYLKKAFSDKFGNLEVDIMSFYNKRSKNDVSDVIDPEVTNEVIELYNSFLEDTKENTKDEMEKNNKPLFHNGKMSISDILKDDDYLNYRKLEIERIIHQHYKDSIYTSGLVYIEDYKEKMRFLNSGIGYFGLHIQGQNIRFFDADFCNILECTQFISDTITLEELSKLLNIELKSNGYDEELLEVPDYNNEKLKFTSLKNQNKVFIRFNSFSNALKAHQILKSGSLKNIVSSKINSPVMRFYNNTFISGVDLVLKNTLSNFEKHLHVKSDYIRNEINQ